MSATTPARRTALAEQAETLSRLERIATGDERRLASELYESDRALEEERSRLLARFEQLATGLQPETAAQGAVAQGTDLRGPAIRCAAPKSAAAEGMATHGTTPANAAILTARTVDSHSEATLSHTGTVADEELERSNRDRVRELERRTAALLVAWRIRQGEIAGAIAEIREGRRVLASYLASESGCAGLDISG